MRTLKDFLEYSDTTARSLYFGPADENGFSRSCAVGYRDRLYTNMQTGIQFCMLDAGVKVVKPTGKGVTNHKFKLKSGKYLHMDIIANTDTYKHKTNNHRVRDSVVLGTTSDEFMSISLSHMYMVHVRIINGWSKYEFGKSGRYDDYKRVHLPGATKKELVGIRKEIKEAFKGKLVGVLYSHEYYTDQLAKVKETFNIFNKKPRFVKQLNNTNHVGRDNYLTLELYQY